MRGLWYAFKQRLMRSYGNDALGTFIIVLSFVFMLANIFLDLFVLWLLWALLYVWYMCRFFSTNYAARQRELGKFRSLTGGISKYFRHIKRRWQDKEHKYLKCPKCSAILRVPRGKGRITVSCPRCGEKKNTKS